MAKINLYGQLVSAQLENLSLDPTPGRRGRVFYNTAEGKAKIDTGAAIVTIGSVGFDGMFPLILGSSAQVTSGIATHSTWGGVGGVIAAASDGSYIKVLTGTWTETITISKKLCIVGQGNGSVMDGTVTFTTAADNSMLSRVRITGNVTLNSGASFIHLVNFVQAVSTSITDNGTGNYIVGIRES